MFNINVENRIRYQRNYVPKNQEHFGYPRTITITNKRIQQYVNIQILNLTIDKNYICNEKLFFEYYKVIILVGA